MRAFETAVFSIVAQSALALLITPENTTGFSTGRLFLFFQLLAFGNAWIWCHYKNGAPIAGAWSACLLPMTLCGLANVLAVFMLEGGLFGSAHHPKEGASLLFLSSTFFIPATVFLCQRERIKVLEKSNERWRYLRHHFLFNSLNTTVCLLHTHPKLAEANLHQLAELFRAVMKQNHIISLKEELETVKLYLEIEKTRLGGKLKVVWEIDPQIALKTRVPAMFLQPLLENAVYHGIETCADTGTIFISIHRHDLWLCFEIRNPEGRVPKKHVHGNQQTHERIEKLLSQVFGNRSYINHRQDACEHIVTFKIPMETEL